MTRDKIQERIKTLETERDNTKNLLVMYEGALQDAKFWLSELDKSETEAKETEPQED